MVTVVSCLFVEICLLFIPSPNFSFKSVFRKMEWQWETQRNNSEKRVGNGQVVQPNGTSWDKLKYVGQVGQGEGGLQILVRQVGQGEGGLQIFVGQVGQGQGVCPLEQFHFSQMGLQGRGTFRISFLLFPSVFHEHVGTGIVRIFLFPSLFRL